MLRRLAPVLFCGPVLWCAELPIRQVILYKHGVGFFERSGSIAAGDSARLDFKAAEMNDVLKSLIINGEGASVSGLRYDSGVALDQRLGDFPFRIDGAQPLSGVLDQLKGARVEMQTANEKIAGAIVAARAVQGDKDHGERQQIVLLLDSGDMRTFDLDAALSIRFTDAKLQAQFRDYLGALTAARSKEKRSVYIDGKLSGGRDITAAYIIPTPIWKSSYRLLFAEAGEPVLEGWAIVDNTTGEDWTGVQMALVSGKPISFISELYLPRYVQRQTAELPEEQAVKPELHEGAAGGVLGGVIGSMAVDVGSATMVSPSPPGAMSMSGRMLAKSKVLRPSDSLASAAGSELADLFEYRIAQPVTIQANQSAMLPFLQEKIKGRKIDLYSDSLSAHPLTAAELTNSTAKTLDGGPITVYDGGAYVGEALVETVKAGDKRLVSYGVDLGTRVTSAIDAEQDREIREIHARRGVITARAATIRKTTYTIRNIDAKAKTLILEHAFEESFRVLNQTPSETTASRWRFELKLAAAATQTFPIVQEKVESEETLISQLTPDTIVEYTQNKHLSEAGRKDLQQILDLKQQIAQANSGQQDTQAKIHTTEQDEQRVRQNLDSLNRISGQQDLVQKYSAQLAELETRMASLRDRQSEFSRNSAALQMELDELIGKTAF